MPVLAPSTQITTDFPPHFSNKAEMFNNLHRFGGNVSSADGPRRADPLHKHEQEGTETETDTVERKGKYKSLVKAEVSPLYSTVLNLAAAPAPHTHMGSMMWRERVRHKYRELFFLKTRSSAS